jgi:hypothetical protein
MRRSDASPGQMPIPVTNPLMKGVSWSYSVARRGDFLTLGVNSFSAAGVFIVWRDLTTFRAQFRSAQGRALAHQAAIAELD